MATQRRSSVPKSEQPPHTRTTLTDGQSQFAALLSEPNSDIVGGADDISHFIKRVTFKLHDTYAVPNRSVYARRLCLRLRLTELFNSDVDKPPFEVTETG